MPRLCFSFILLLSLVACSATPSAAPQPSPTVAQASPIAPAAALLPTVAAPTALPITATAPSTARLPTATAQAAPTRAPTLKPTQAPASSTAAPALSLTVPPAPAPSAAGKPQPAPAAVNQPLRLVIPAIDLDRQLLSVGLDRNRVPVVPNHDVGWYNLSARPGQGENIVLWGHVLRFRETPKIPAPFARLKELPIGARLTLYNAEGVAHQYEVIETVQATPDQIEFMLPKGRELLTLISCIGDKVVLDGSVEMTHRLITIAAPVEG